MNTEYEIVEKIVPTHDMFGNHNGTVTKYDIVGSHTKKIYASNLDKHDKDISLELLEGTSDELPKRFYSAIL